MWIELHQREFWAGAKIVAGAYSTCMGMCSPGVKKATILIRKSNETAEDGEDTLVIDGTTLD
jgi:hypothetical protein